LLLSLLFLPDEVFFALAEAAAADDLFFTEFRRLFCDDGISSSIRVENNNGLLDRCSCKCPCIINDDDDGAVPKAVVGRIIDVDRA